MISEPLQILPFAFIYLVCPLPNGHDTFSADLILMISKPFQILPFTRFTWPILMAAGAFVFVCLKPILLSSCAFVFVCLTRPPGRKCPSDPKRLR